MPNNTVKKKTTFSQKIILVMLGVILSVTVIEISLRVGGIVYLSLQKKKGRAALAAKGTYRILCLGDSNTALGGLDSYPSQLEKILNQKILDIKFAVINKGIPGASSIFIISQLKYNLDRYKPNMVIVMMGASDVDAVLPIQIITIAKIKSFIKSLRFYKLVKLLQMRLWEKTIIHQKYLDLGEYYQSQEDYSKSEEMFKLAIKIYPRSCEDYIKLGWCYSEQGKYSEAEETFKKAIDINPYSLDAYLELGLCYSDQNRHREAEEVFKKAVNINPKNLDALITLGWCYSEQGKYNEAEEAFKKAIILEPLKDIPYRELGQYYIARHRYSQAEEIFKKALVANPQKNDNIYSELALYYQEHQMHQQAEEMFKKALSVRPQENDTIYFELALYYQKRQMHQQAEEMFKKTIEINPNNEYAYRSLGVLNRLKGRKKEAESYFKKAEFITGYCNKITRANYIRLKDVVLKRGIKLVCATYPMRSVQPLILVFGNNKDILLVDNETVFKTALKNGQYEDYFVDRYGGDYGHCTAKGNRLLAENIANSLIGYLGTVTQ